MLTAFTKNGKKLCLGNEYKKETLLYFREREDFFCPICSQKVIMKLGEKRIFHFSHFRDSECNDCFENESEYHLLGKRQLFQWLKKQKVPVELEYYDKEIRQRPDVLFKLNGQKYALEFQCSTINQDLVSKRTKAYMDSNYFPLWILGAKQLQRRTNGIASLSNFHYLFLRRDENARWRLPFYCPDSQNLLLLHSLHPFSPQSALAELTVYPLQKMSLKQFSIEKPPSKTQSNRWIAAIRKVKMNCIQYPSFSSSLFLKELYQNHLNLFLLPPQIGLPICNAPFFSTSPILWQAYLYIDLFHNKHPGEIVTLFDAKRCLLLRIKRKHIAVRTLPQLAQDDFTSAIAEYLKVLEKIGVLEYKKSGIYSIARKMKIPETVGEQQELEDLFYQRYGEMIFSANGIKKK
ncbi:MAG: competence protein CoiA family protein [Bacillota bacterium]|nr:competence protein CoiA family protein [Bacillota bacterium]